MTRHRKLPIALGVLQLLAAGVLFLFDDGIMAKFSGRESIHAAMEIVEALEARGELAVPEDSIEADQQRAVISRTVHEKLEMARSATPVMIGILAFFGVLVLLAGSIPDRRRERPRPSDEPLA